jgi:hypothetical protein
MRNLKYYLAAVAVGCLVVMPQGSPASSASLGFAMLSHNAAEMEQSRYGLQIAHRSRYRRTVRITGVVTDEGVECTALRGDDGRLYTLAGRVEGLEPGDRVRVVGRLAEASFCMQGTTIEVRRIFATR